VVKSREPVRYHPGPFGKIPARATTFGILFAAAFVFLAWVGLPDYRWFWIASGMGGISIALCLYISHGWKEPKDDELSIRAKQ
jgi:hypothetical protein